MIARSDKGVRYPAAMFAAAVLVAVIAALAARSSAWVWIALAVVVDACVSWYFADGAEYYERGRKLRGWRKTVAFSAYFVLMPPWIFANLWLLARYLPGIEHVRGSMEGRGLALFVLPAVGGPPWVIFLVFRRLMKEPARGRPAG